MTRTINIYSLCHRESLTAKQRQSPYSAPTPVYQDSSMRHDWPEKKPLSILLISLAAQNKDFGTALQMLLTGVKYYVCDARLQFLPTEDRLKLKIFPDL